MITTHLTLSCAKIAILRSNGFVLEVWNKLVAINIVAN
jgi:hypothetical protein